MHDTHPLPGEDTVVEGVRLHYVRHGRDDDRHRHPPLLLVHGLPTSSYVWHDVMRDLGHEHRSVAPDLVGFGRSERPIAAAYDLATQAHLLWRLLDRLKVHRPVLVGHELGGAVVTHMAASAPERVAGLVLVNAVVHADAWPVPAALPLMVPGVRSAYVGGLRRTPALATRVLSRALRPDVPGAALRRHVSALASADGARGLLRFARALDLAAVEQAWGAVCAAAPPALVLWGERNHQLSSAYGRRLCAELPGAAWVPVDGGPLVPQERPERVAEEIDGFVADLAPVTA